LIEVAWANDFSMAITMGRASPVFGESGRRAPVVRLDDTSHDLTQASPDAVTDDGMNDVVCCRINREPRASRTHDQQIMIPVNPVVDVAKCVSVSVSATRSHSRFHTRGNPLHAASKIGLESRLDLGCIRSRIVTRKHDALRNSRSSVRHDVKSPLEG
jgi:hypothetical protein